MIDLQKSTAVAFATILCGLGLAGCASFGSRGAVDVARYEAMDCVELNKAVRKTSTDISQIAITRGKAEEVTVPRWVLGGARVQASYAERQTTKIERLRQEQDAALSVRRGKCGS